MTTEIAANQIAEEVYNNFESQNEIGCNVVFTSDVVSSVYVYQLDLPEVKDYAESQREVWQDKFNVCIVIEHLHILIYDN